MLQAPTREVIHLLRQTNSLSLLDYSTSSRHRSKVSLHVLNQCLYPLSTLDYRISTSTSSLDIGLIQNSCKRHCALVLRRSLIIPYILNFRATLSSSFSSISLLSSPSNVPLISIQNKYPVKLKVTALSQQLWEVSLLPRLA